MPKKEIIDQLKAEGFVLRKAFIEGDGWRGFVYILVKSIK